MSELEFRAEETRTQVRHVLQYMVSNLGVDVDNERKSRQKYEACVSWYRLGFNK